VTSDGIHTLFLGCVAISNIGADAAAAFATTRERLISPRLPTAMPLSFFLDLALALQPPRKPEVPEV
jgi:hypothetical protein